LEILDGEEKGISRNMWYEPERDIDRWSDFQRLIECRFSEISSSSRWIFRGEYSDKEPCTKLEDTFTLYGMTTSDQRVKCERSIIRGFRRKASLYIESEPDKNDMLEWLAVMQHHGAPTRLVDFTYSAYVALYFALAQKINGTIWAINAAITPGTVTPLIEKYDPAQKRLNEMRNELKPLNDMLKIREEGDKLEDLAITCYLLERPVPLIYPVNPFRLNRRLTAQQGLFLLSGDIAKSFSENLRSYFHNDDSEARRNVHKINFTGDPEQRKEVIHQLSQMNIGSESLFQGIDGFARSTVESLARPHALDAIGPI
jgi:hypothetical protein